MGKARQALRALIRREIRFDFERIPIRVRNASYRKIVNWLLVEAALVLKREQPWGWPTFVQIEPTSHCNLKCGFCPVSTHTGPRGHIAPELFRKLIDEVAPTALLVVLWGWGEPFICPGIYDLIAHAKRAGLQLISSTNGLAFADPAEARRLVQSGIDALIVSTSGITQESYERFRQGKLDEALQGVRNIAEAKRALGSPTPHISLTLMVTQHNEHEVRLAREIAAEVSADRLSLKKINTATTDHTQRAIPADERYRRFRYEGDDPRPVRARRNLCKALWQKTNLRWDGRINSCTFDFAGVSDLGDLRRSSLREIWRGARYRAMRERFRADWQQLQICSSCTYAYAGGNYTEVIAESFSFDDER